ncbi:RICIN domain-containing protein [Streptomyces sp. NRRL B-3229]|uniref:RICIN domain-containing protein n=1 Tax=Streptomyces sp. NRRL B-3229 TaxID=1463836 RepID=UPI00099DB3A4|nr:RICIN domain-containing protein [Streptomyces sp. NRRL B-3229]
MRRRVNRTAATGAAALAVLGLSLVPVAPAAAATGPQDGHVYALTVAHSGKNAQVDSGSQADAADVVQKTASGDPSQLWQAVAGGDGSFSLVNINSGKCLDVKGASTAAEAHVIQWPCTGGSNQRWTFSGSAIVSAVSGMCLDVPGGSTADGTSLIQWPCNGNTNQQWSLTERPRAVAFGPGMTAGGDSFSEQTLRMVVHTSAAGSGVRIRLSNLHSTTALSVGAVDVAVRSSGAAAVPGTHRTVTFGRSGNPTVAAGAELISDVIPMSVTAGQDLLVSVYLRGTTGASTFHRDAFQTSYRSAAGSGNHAGEDAAGNFTTSMWNWHYLSGVDVVPAAVTTGTVVAFGDSITDGYDTTTDANRRWPDRLAARLQSESGGQRLAVADAGISGNMVLRATGWDPQGPAGVDRFAHDALGQPGVRDVIFMEGINDVNGTPSLTADQLINGYRNIITQAHAAGVRIIGGTMLPHSTQSSAQAAVRTTVNNWIRTSGAFDAVVDFDAVVRDPNNPAQMLPAYDSGDHLHPNDAGMQAMANAVDLSVLR